VVRIILFNGKWAQLFPDLERFGELPKKYSFFPKLVSNQPSQFQPLLGIVKKITNKIQIIENGEVFQVGVSNIIL
jgi:hypothetical protein